MAVLRVDEYMEVIGNGSVSAGPIVYGDRWYVEHALISADTLRFPRVVTFYRGEESPRGFLLRSAVADFNNRTVSLNIELQPAERLIMRVEGLTETVPPERTVGHIIGRRILAYTGYPEEHRYAV